MQGRAEDGAGEVLPDLVRGGPAKNDPREKITQRAQRFAEKRRESRSLAALGMTKLRTLCRDGVERCSTPTKADPRAQSGVTVARGRPKSGSPVTEGRTQGAQRHESERAEPSGAGQAGGKSFVARNRGKGHNLTQ